MIDEALLDTFLGQFQKLNLVVSESSARALQDPPDALFYEHQNVFIKSYLVSACSILEAYIQDLATAYLDIIQSRINSANLPHNLVVWAADHQKAKLNFKKFEAKKSKKDISKTLSPNFWKTMKSFERLGVDLSSPDIASFKEYITNTVEKRNSIVHHNDDALDLSFSDVTRAIDEFQVYARHLYEKVCADPHLNS